MLRCNFQAIDQPRREKIAELVNANPRISLKELAEAVHIDNTSNIHYHIRRLEKKGLVQWQGSVRKHAPQSERAKQLRWNKGFVRLPKMTLQQLNERIEMVAKKAEGAGLTGEPDPSEDVVRIIRGRLFRNDRIRANRIG
jgi:SOS-response transcriptional repressor LexA